MSLKLSIVIICWNDRAVLEACLHSLYQDNSSTDFEVIISDNDSTDDSLSWLEENYPQARIVRNGANLGFSRGNNAGFAHVGESTYTLFLNPDTIFHPNNLDQWIPYADQHPEAGAFGCRVDNPDGTLQSSGYNFPTNSIYFRMACRPTDIRCLLPLSLDAREIDWQSGCCIMVRTKLFRELSGFDDRFFYHYEEVDLCLRIHQAGFKILFSPDIGITHLGGQSVGRSPTRFQIETYRSRYRYFYKHFGAFSTRCTRWVLLFEFYRQYWGSGIKNLLRLPRSSPERRESLRIARVWNLRLDPVRFNQTGEEPDVGMPPLASWSLNSKP